jgi:hypothetical protein
MNSSDLHQVAKEVESMIVDIDSAKRCFQDHIGSFNEDWERYWQARHAEPQPSVDSPDNKESGFVYRYEGDYVDPGSEEGEPDYTPDGDDACVGVWFPAGSLPLPPNPLDWKISNKLSCYYTTLAVIHDHIKREYTRVKLCEGILSRVCFHLMVLDLEQASFDSERLITALKWVRKDLAAAGHTQDESGRKEPFGFHKRASRYVFKSEGATWRIIYEEHETTVKDSLGMKYIRYLMKHPNTSIECRDIERACSTESPDSGRRLDSGEAIEADLHANRYDLKRLDSWDAKDIKSALDKLNADIEDTDDPARKAELQKDAGHLAEYLRKNLNRHGRPRSVDEREQARSRVQKAINAAKRAITRADEHIGSHFEAVKGEGTSYIYRPSSNIPWAFE